MENREDSSGFCDEIGWKQMSLGVEEPGVEEGQPGGKTAWNGGNEGRRVSLRA